MGEVGKIGGVQPTPNRPVLGGWIMAELDGDLMTRRNPKTKQVEYKVGVDGPLGKDANEAKELYAQKQGAKQGATYAFGEEKITGKAKPEKPAPLTPEQIKARQELAKKVVEPFIPKSSEEKPGKGS